MVTSLAKQWRDYEMLLKGKKKGSPEYRPKIFDILNAMTT